MRHCAEERGGLSHRAQRILGHQQRQHLPGKNPLLASLDRIDLFQHLRSGRGREIEGGGQRRRFIECSTYGRAPDMVGVVVSAGFWLGLGHFVRVLSHCADCSFVIWYQ